MGWTRTPQVPWVGIPGQDRQSEAGQVCGEFLLKLDEFFHCLMMGKAGWEGTLPYHAALWHRGSVPRRL